MEDLHPGHYRKPNQPLTLCTKNKENPGKWWEMGPTKIFCRYFHSVWFFQIGEPNPKSPSCCFGMKKIELPHFCSRSMNFKNLPTCVLKRIQWSAQAGEVSWTSRDNGRHKLDMFDMLGPKVIRRGAATSSKPSDIPRQKIEVLSDWYH